MRAGVPGSPGTRAERIAPARYLLWALIVLALALGRAGAGQAAPVTDQTVSEVAAELRCVVCQNLSVADSPSEMAAQMRAIIRERLAAGETPEQVQQYFVDRYGEWILLAPRRRGFNLIVWLMPIATVVVGAAIVAVSLRRWTRRPPGPPPAVDTAMRERIRREMENEP